MVPYKNNSGFTLVSVVLAISIIIMLLPLTTYFIQSISFTSKYDELSVYQFFYFIRNDTILAKDYDIRDNNIVFQLQSDEEATISQYGQLIRRQVEHKGHEIYLRNIEHMQVSRIPFGFHITITTIQGERYEKSFTFYK